MIFRARWVIVLLAGVVLGITLSVAGRVMAERSAAPATAVAEAPVVPWEDARLLAEILQRVREYYVDPVDDHQLMRQAMHGMVEGLDEYSGFLESDEYAALKLMTSGSYAGIGIEVEAVADGVRITGSMAGSPAARAGVHAGDLIVTIDGRRFGADQLDAAVNSVRGEPGSRVRLSVLREGRPLDFDIVRSEVELPSVAAQLLAPDYGYLRISSFTESTADEFARELVRLQGRANGNALQGLVIDLRNNPGGVLDAAVAVADDFLEQGVIVSGRGRNEDAAFIEQAEPGDLLPGARIAVLVNGGSASAAEILAAALRDNNRATLYGRRTYGKGSVQSVMPLSGGQALKLTTANYYTPNGQSLNQRGITPDVVINVEEAPLPALDAADAAPTLARRDSVIGVALQGLRGRPHLAAVPVRPRRS